MKPCSPRTQVWIIRVVAAVSLVTLPAVFAPRLAVEKLSWFLGFGEPPDAPLLFYLAGGGSFVYIALSALLWRLSYDVPRYRPAIVLIAVACLIGVPIFGWMNIHAGMPWWWAAMDMSGCLVGGYALLRAAGPAEEA